jgi:hypothetical protein
MDDTGARAVQISSDVAEAVRSTRADCARMSANLIGLRDQVSEMLRASDAFVSSAEQKAEYEKKYGNPITVAMRSTLVDAARCNDNVAVRDFLQSVQHRR